eukprot:TRINITY_DN2510_c0_g3_i1.p1 TRINITY_DN2510_c0_g3~~TRINITY_DN2510_c0_g3_i1.p1  ORF type:complete len:135 (-),score=22.61 TRINITY_DN2510_c0_g3_i1:105-509(-)
MEDDIGKSRLSLLSKRVVACEALTGSPAVGAESGGDASAVTASLSARLKKIAEDVQEKLSGEDLRAFEKGMNEIDSWLKSENAHESRIVLNSFAKRQYLAHHIDFLQGLIMVMREVKELEPYADPSKGDRKSVV